jgi:hypothetical protein
VSGRTGFCASFGVCFAVYQSVNATEKRVCCSEACRCFVLSHVDIDLIWNSDSSEKIC